MFFFTGRKRTKLLQTPLTDDQRALMHRAAPLTAQLPADRRTGHEGVVQVLLHEKTFEGTADLAITDEMRLCIAGQAALLQLRDGADYYPGLDTILVYPEAFTVENEHHDEYGLVTEAEDDLSGESWQRGVVVLAWSDVQDEATDRNGYNVVLHEFAHQLDDQTGTADGTPLLTDADLGASWASAFQAALEKHRRLASSATATSCSTRMRPQAPPSSSRRPSSCSSRSRPTWPRRIPTSTPSWPPIWSWTR